MRQYICILTSLLLSLAFSQASGIQSGLSVTSGVSPTPYIFRHISTHQGMPENYIGSVLRLPDGRMAMRGADLIIWDGARFSRFPEPDSVFYPIGYGPMNFNQYVDRDNRVWMKRRGELILFDLTTDKYIANIDSIFKKMGLNGHIDGLNIDSQGSFWITTDGSLYRQDKGASLIKIADLQMGTLFMEAQRSTDNRMAWLLFTDGTLVKWDCRDNREVMRANILAGHVKPGDQAVIRPINESAVAVMTDNAMGIFNETSGKWTPLLPYNENPNHKYTSMEIDNKGKIWVGQPKHGFHIIDTVTGNAVTYPDFPLLSGKRISHDVQHIYADPVTGGIWLSLHDNGILYYNHHSPVSFYLDLHENGMLAKDDAICSMLMKRNGTLLLGTGKGIYSVAKRGDRPQRIAGITDGATCRRLLEDSKGRLWIGTFNKGLILSDNEGTRQVIYSSTDYHDNLNYNNIRTIAEDPNGRIWIGVYGGFGVIDNATLQYELVTGNDKIFREYGLINDMAVSPDGKITVACDKGTFNYNPQDGKVTRLLDGITTDSEAVRPDRVRCNSVAYDKDRNLWLGTHTGVAVVTPDGDVCRFGINEGLTQPVHKILSDDRGRLWLSTASSIYSVELIKEYGQSTPSGIRLMEYLNDKAIPDTDQLSFLLVSDHDDIVSSTKNGLLYMFPATDSIMAARPAQRQPMFNTLNIAGIDIAPGEMINGRVLTDKVLGTNPAIRLHHNENNLTIGFVNLDFDNLSSATFRYRLEGFDHNWTEVTFHDPQGQVTYNNLPPGSYHLRVSAVMQNGNIGPEAVLSIYISTPWWSTWWFRLITFIMFIVIAALILRHLHRNRVRRADEEATRREETKKKELEEMKLRFFTNVSHELRTPLTMIITPLQAIIDKTDENSPLRPKLTVIHQNARNLLMQVNQLLDFRKLEVGADKFIPSPCDLVDLIRINVASFLQGAADRGIEIKCILPPHRVVVEADKPKLSRIFTNLLSNAIKYTPRGGEVKIELSTDTQSGYATISVADTGIGIPENERSKIFDRFYRASNASEIPEAVSSSGVGLHIVKEYLKLHKGEIEVKSEPGKGSEFIVSLPLPSLAENTGEETEKTADRSKPVVLLAEDNEEFRSFLAGELSAYYNVVDVEDGAKALAKARQLNPLIIVSDVMMPRMDGIALTKAVKKDLATSHIPVVLLTAHANEGDETTGYEAGADAYISKPFNMNLLLTRIANLIEQQRGRWEKFDRHLNVNPAEISISSPDEKLIGKALDTVEKHLDDSDFSVENLAEELGMSKATLYRKLQAITGQTPVNFIRTIRLKRAAQLLRTTSNPISEIAYRTGFSSPRYFSRLFKEEYGVLPTEYRSASLNEK